MTKVIKKVGDKNFISCYKLPSLCCISLLSHCKISMSQPPQQVTFRYGLCKPSNGCLSSPNTSTLFLFLFLFFFSVKVGCLFRVLPLIYIFLTQSDLIQIHFSLTTIYRISYLYSSNGSSYRT